MDLPGMGSQCKCYIPDRRMQRLEKGSFLCLQTGWNGELGAGTARGSLAARTVVQMAHGMARRIGRTPSRLCPALCSGSGNQDILCPGMGPPHSVQMEI